MSNNIVNEICDRLLNIKDFFKLYYSYDEDNEFKIWVEYHDQDNQVNLFYDRLHSVVDDNFSTALASLFDNKPTKIKKLLEDNKVLREFFADHLFILEIFKKEWESYLSQEGEYTSILLLPDNDVNDAINKEEDDDKVIKFEENKDKNNK